MLHTILTVILIAPLVGSIIAGLFGRQVGRTVASLSTILGVAVSVVLSAYVFMMFVIDGHEAYNASLYTWMVSDGVKFEIGFMIDELSATMMLVVTFVSLMVSIDL